MKTPEDALALCEREQDNFYFTAYMIESWVAELSLRMAEEYAEKKSAAERRLQAGLAQQTFEEIFGHTDDQEFPCLYLVLLRFAEYDDPQSRLLMYAICVLEQESPMEAELRRLKLEPRRNSSALGKLSRKLAWRLCEWLEAEVHHLTHVCYYLSPVSFDADPDRRELATLGVAQRFFPKLNDFGKAWWQWHHAAAAERWGASPKWQTLGAAMASEAVRHHEYAEVDSLVIGLWPLVKKHNWTYRDLANVAREFTSRPNAYPLRDERELSTYCTNVLGLRKASAQPGRTTPSKRPPGIDLARRLCGPAVPPVS